MKFPESWLRDFVDSPLSGEALAHALTMAGLESEELLSAAPAFSGVVVAKVLSVVKHPDADRLNVCQVDVGQAAPTQIVCGAPNVAAGMTVPCALPGALLPGDFKIKVAKVRGVESNGMLCSAKELGLSEDAAGLLPLDAALTAGTDFRLALQLDDVLHVLKMTPNRGDCLSLLGVAREVSAITGAPLRVPQAVDIVEKTAAARAVVLDAPAACPRYLGRVIEGVDAKAATPEWMKRRLERCGLRSISALVDITNYVMLELGQPLHAFDNALLEGDVHVRMAHAGDTLLLLNGQRIDIAPDVLVIADEKKVLAMAGVMGGEESGISLDTRNVFLESAFFAPKAIAGRARRYGFVSDASHRYERGVDFAGAVRAMARASELVLQICGGAAGPLTQAERVEHLPSRQQVSLRLPRLRKVLGIDLTGEQVIALLSRLGLPSVLKDDAVHVTAPTHRFDIEIEEDLVEEVARLHGYDNIPMQPPVARLAMMPETESIRPRKALRNVLVQAGYQEVINFAFVEAGWEVDFSGNTDPLRLANPIASQMAVMRTTLFGGLLANLSTNIKRKQPRVRLFEMGRVFRKDSAGVPVAGFDQPWMLSGLAWGTVRPEQWGEAARRVDFHDVKGDVERLLADLPVRFVKAEHPALHPGRSAWIELAGQRVGVLGELHPRWVQKYDLATPPVLFELDVKSLLGAAPPVFAELSNQPAVVRDLALVVDRSTSAQALLDAVQASAPGLVKSFELFDVYAGKGIEEGKKSLALRVVMQDTQKTLQDSEVDAAVSSWVAALEKSIGATLRI